MKLGERLYRLKRYCEEISQWYPVRCEVYVEQGQAEQDSDWAYVVVTDISSDSGSPRTATSKPSPAVNCLEAYLDDLMVKWFGEKETEVS